MMSYQCDECLEQFDDPVVVFNRVSDEARCPYCNSEEIQETE